MEQTIKTKKKVGRPRKEHRGGAREGAGRKPVDNPRVEHVSITTTKDVLQKVQILRELTKQDEFSFNHLFEQWVEGLAQEYGIE